MVSGVVALHDPAIVLGQFVQGLVIDLDSEAAAASQGLGNPVHTALLDRRLLLLSDAFARTIAVPADG